MFIVGDTFTGIIEYETPGNKIGGGKRNAIYNSLNGVIISLIPNTNLIHIINQMIMV